MIITKKIEIFVCEKDEQLRKAYYEKLYANQKAACRAANLAVSNMFALDNSLSFLTPESRETIQYLGAKGNPCSSQNAPYVACSEQFKGTGVDMGMISCVIQNVRGVYKSDTEIKPSKGKFGLWDKSLRSYKGNMPIPFKADRFTHLHFETRMSEKNQREYEDCFFVLMGIPFQMIFGKDRSGNRTTIHRILEQQEYDATNGQKGSPTGYKMCTSSISITDKFDPLAEKKRQVIYLYLCVDIPRQTYDLDPNKAVHAYLGISHPIECLLGEACKVYTEKDRLIYIGDAESFLYRRCQIQLAIKRLQKSCKYHVGGNGRQHKLQALERFHKKEKHYVDTCLHQYSRELVNLALSHGCGSILIHNQKPREDEAKLEHMKGNPFILRNWSYFGLKDKISYKCEMCGIRLDIDDETVQRKKVKKASLMKESQKLTEQE